MLNRCEISDSDNNGDNCVESNNPVPRRLQEFLKNELWYIHIHKFIKNTVQNI
jgi:hypothetical protein